MSTARIRVFSAGSVKRKAGGAHARLREMARPEKSQMTSGEDKCKSGKVPGTNADTNKKCGSIKIFLAFPALPFRVDENGLPCNLNDE